MNVAIVGIGLIGGSMARDLRANGFASHIIGVDLNPQHQEQALALGLVDEICELEMAVKMADLILLAIPVNAISDLLPPILNGIHISTTVVDMGSTKAELAEKLKDHPMRRRLVLAHPMAGTEYSGPTAAIHRLFQDKAAIICNQEESDEDAVKLSEKLFKSLFMRITYMGAKEHDIHAAYVSHISHISSFVLSLTVLDKEKSEANIFNMASGGFASTVRLAKSSPKMWRDVFEQNADNVLDVLDRYIEKIMEFRQHIAEGNFDKTYELMEEANKIRKIIDQESFAKA